jgi:hypothetical protein
VAEGNTGVFLFNFPALPELQNGENGRLKAAVFLLSKFLELGTL